MVAKLNSPRGAVNAHGTFFGGICHKDAGPSTKRGRSGRSGRSRRWRAWPSCAISKIAVIANKCIRWLSARRREAAQRFLLCPSKHYAHLVTNTLVGAGNSIADYRKLVICLFTHILHGATRSMFHKAIERAGTNFRKNANCKRNHVIVHTL